ncbi:MAG: phosphatase PAP2 family protein [Kofleriaceae bacterium]
MRHLAILVTLAAATGSAARAARADAPCPVNALDCVAIGQFSATADATSDALFLTSLAVPVGLELGRGLDDDSLRRGGAYLGAVGATAALAGLVKYTVRRDRPYTQSRDPAVVAYTRTAAGTDHSFFSGHTSIAYAALTSGALLYNPTSQGDGARLAVWAGAGALAGSTGMLRIRAGRHYPTDVLVGAGVGIGLGLGVTYALAPAATLRGSDLLALGAGTAVGALAMALIPLPRDVVLPLGLRDLALTPTLDGHGGGLALAGRLR